VPDVTTNGFFNVTQALVMPMIRSRWGRIVNLAATAGPVNALPTEAAYAAAKAGVVGLTRALAMELVADGVNRLRSPERSMIVITHYQRLLEFIVPDVVHVLAKGRVVKTGGKELALELEATGYAQYVGEAA